MSRKHLPPPTKFLAGGLVLPVQAKRAGMPIAAPCALAPVRPPASATAARPVRTPGPQTGHVLQRVTSPVEVENSRIRIASSVPGVAYPIRLRTEMKRTRRGYELTIYATDWDHADRSAYIHGEVEEKMAWILTLEGGRFPTGKGVGYRLVQEFATKAQLLGATDSRLGTAVNSDSLTKSGYGREAKEWGAIALYTRLGFDVATRTSADESRVDINTLRQRAALQATTKGWS